MINTEEKVVAVIDQKAITETALATKVANDEEAAYSLVVENDAQYAEAGEFGIHLKQAMSEVTDFFAPMKKAAHEAHKNICDREKQMLTPLKNAEAALKKSMGAYALKKEQERKAAEEAARRLAQEEAERKLAEAIKAEENGDETAVKAALLDAEIADSASRMATVDVASPKAKGVSVRKDWEITDIDLSKVPDTVMGVVIRPVDTAAVMKLVRASKGAIKIDGITYKETANMSFRK